MHPTTNNQRICSALAYDLNIQKWNVIEGRHMNLSDSDIFVPIIDPNSFWMMSSIKVDQRDYMRLLCEHGPESEIGMPHRMFFCKQLSSTEVVMEPTKFSREDSCSFHAVIYVSYESILHCPCINMAQNFDITPSTPPEERSSWKFNIYSAFVHECSKLFSRSYEGILDMSNILNRRPFIEIQNRYSNHFVLIFPVHSI